LGASKCAPKLGDDEVLAAVIVRNPAAFDPPTLIDFLTPRMPPFRIPRHVEVMDDRKFDRLDELLRRVPPDLIDAYRGSGVAWSA
jgi:hypothetical protein